MNKKNDLEILYRENINRKTQEIDNMTENFELKTNIKNTIEKNKNMIIIISIIFIGLITFIWLYSYKLVLAFIFMIFTIVLLSIIFNSFSVKYQNKKLIIKTITDEIEIDEKKIKNLYLEENYYRIFIKKRKNYTLVILYETPKGNILDIRLSTYLISCKDLNDMFVKIKLKEKIVNNQEKCNKYKRKRLLKKAILFIIMSLITFIFLLFSY